MDNDASIKASNDRKPRYQKPEFVEVQPHLTINPQLNSPALSQATISNMTKPPPPPELETSPTPQPTSQPQDLARTRIDMVTIYR